MTPIIVALDFAEKKTLLALVDQLDPTQCRLKIGKEVFTRFGPELVRELQNKGFEIFLDLKFHDIPNTVVKALQSAADLGVWMVNVHALGGIKMMEQSAKVMESYKTLLIAVTILTSTSDHDLALLGLPKSDEMVMRLAQLAAQSKMDGVVCSALEAKAIKQATGSDFLTVTPGIRLLTDRKDDQTRIMTPKAAIDNSADYLVIGRPITQSQQPADTLNNIISTL